MFGVGTSTQALDLVYQDTVLKVRKVCEDVSMWLFYAFSAAIIWGLDYTLSERVLKSKVSPLTLIAIQMGIGAIVFGLIGLNLNLKQDLQLIISDRRVMWLCLAALTSFNLGNLMIFLSIQAKNAALAGLIELSYPIFTILFTYLIFKENQINWGVVAGGALILIGAGVVSFYA